MKYHLQITHKANIEFLVAYDWYQNQQLGLGDKFRKEIYKFFDLSLINPKHYSIKNGELREIVLKKYPFVIVYRIQESNKTIYIASIFHIKRNPKLK